MSYIRTKDSVYELKENMTIENGVYSFFGKIYDTTEKHLFRNDKDLGEFVSQSENLEELCDGFYNDILGDGIFNFDGLYIYNDFDSFKDDWFGYRTYDDWRGNGYGFIKTDKGLIYVAKLNDKGELVLI